MPVRARKRHAPRWKTISFPTLDKEKHFNELDLTLWAPSVIPDVLIISDYSEFQAHKQSLSAVSTVMKLFFEGDSTIESIEMKGFSEKSIKLFYDLIYDTPAQRKERFKKPRTGEVLDALKLAAKYDIQVLRDLLMHRIEHRFWFRGKAFYAIYDCCVSLGFTDIAEALKICQMRNMYKDNVELNTFKTEDILDAVDANDFESKTQFELFSKVAETLHSTKDPQIKTKLKNVGIPGTAWKRKYKLEKKKSDALIELLPKLP